MSTLDENGILVYDETDVRDTFSDLLNIGQNATSDAIGADRARIAVLEAKTELTDTAANPAVVASGWNLLTQVGRKKDGTAWVRVRVARTGGSISGGASGNIPNQLIATFAPGWVPASGMNYLAAAVDTGPLVSGYAEASGIWLAALPPNTTITNGDEFSVGTYYPLA